MATNAQVLNAIFNAGERLVPGETHDRAEIVRHKSSYQFFRRVIESDIISNPDLLKTEIRVLDIGCGTGHGTFMLGNILGAKIVGIDPSIESIQYAKENYFSDNIEYLNNNVEAFINNASPFDYVVSRHALEHVEDGLNFALTIVCHRRLMVNVPFNESEGNIHHKVHWINESHFEFYPNREFLYEGLDGVTTLDRSDNNPPNSIICISSISDLGCVRNLFDFPLPAWQPEFLQNLGIDSVEAGFNIREAELTARDAEAAQREAELTARAAEVAQHETELTARTAKVAQHEAELTARVAELAQRDDELAARAAEVMQRDAELTARAAKVAQCETEVAGRVQQYNNLRLVRILRWLKSMVKP